MKGTDVWGNTGGEVEHVRDHVATVDPDHAPSVVDRRLRHELVDLAVHRQSEDHRYHSDLVVVLQNVDLEAVASLSAGTFVVLKGSTL